MGIFGSLFDGLFDTTPHTNDAEKEAYKDYVKEWSDSGGKDPTPKEAPDWAEDIGPKSK